MGDLPLCGHHQICYSAVAPSLRWLAFLALHVNPLHHVTPLAGIVTSDAAQQQPLGIMHLLAGVQAAAAQHWNESHPDTSLGLVALELDFSPRGAALLAAPGPGGSPRRLKVRPVKPGVIELLPRDVPAAPSGAQEGAVALQSSGGAAAEGAWPLTSVSPMQLQVRREGVLGVSGLRWDSFALQLRSLQRGVGATLAQTVPCLPACPCCSRTSACCARSSAAGCSRQAQQPRARAAAARSASRQQRRQASLPCASPRMCS